MQVGVSIWYPANPSGLDASAAALIARMTTPPTTARVTLINNLIVSLKNAGVWDSLDALWIVAAADSQAASLNWKGFNFTLSPVNTPTFTADRGYAGDGTTSYLDTGLTATSTLKATQNDTALGIYVNVSSGYSSSIVDIGAAVSGSFQSLMRTHDSATGFAYRVNQSVSSFVTTGVTTAVGNTVISRTASNSVGVYRNGVSIAGTTQASSGLPTVNLYLLALNVGGVASFYSNRRIASAHYGAGLSAQNVLDLTNAINTYLTAVGAA